MKSWTWTIRILLIVAVVIAAKVAVRDYVARQHRGIKVGEAKSMKIDKSLPEIDVYCQADSRVERGQIVSCSIIPLSEINADTKIDFDCEVDWQDGNSPEIHPDCYKKIFRHVYTEGGKYAAKVRPVSKEGYGKAARSNPVRVTPNEPMGKSELSSIDYNKVVRGVRAPNPTISMLRRLGMRDTERNYKKMLGIDDEPTRSLSSARCNNEGWCEPEER